MRFILTISLTLLSYFTSGQSISECPVVEKVTNKVRVEVCGLTVEQFISRRHLIEEGFALQLANKAYKNIGFTVVIPCQSEWLMDTFFRKFIGNVAPPNDKALRLLRVGETLHIRSITLERNGQCYWTTGVDLTIVE